MNINLSFDTRAAAAPASFRGAIQAAANLLNTIFIDNITVTIGIGYGEYPATGALETNGGASASAVFHALPYSQVRSWLSANAAPVVQSGVNALPTTSSFYGYAYTYVSTAEEKLMGQSSSNSSGFDGYAGFATDISLTSLVGVAVHEITHALGRMPYGANIFDFFRYSGVVQNLLTGTIPSVASYFSLDGGKTHLADYGQVSDPSDFKNTSATQGDPFDEYYNASTAQSLTSLDILQMEALGYHVGSAVAAAPSNHANDLSFAPSAGGTNHFIDMVNFEASFPDLITAFGSDSQAMARWFVAYEPAELRVATFNGLDYVASYPDLIRAFGTPNVSQTMLQDAGASHEIANGLGEGRSTTFNALDYIASYADLSRALGSNADAGAMHFIQYGVSEGRTTTFDGLSYIASYNDLMGAFGANEQAGANHFITAGNAEGRSSSFNTQAYLAAHADLQGAYATSDQFLAAYINTYVQTGHYLV